jgi:hypothetical protein
MRPNTTNILQHRAKRKRIKIVSISEINKRSEKKRECERMLTYSQANTKKRLSATEQMKCSYSKAMNLDKKVFYIKIADRAI